MLYGVHVVMVSMRSASGGGGSCVEVGKESLQGGRYLAHDPFPERFWRGVSQIHAFPIFGHLIAVGLLNVCDEITILLDDIFCMQRCLTI